MFAIYLDYDDELDLGARTLVSHKTPMAAIRDVDRIARQTRAQLHANGEGHSGFRLRLCIYDTDTQRMVGQSSDRV